MPLIKMMERISKASNRFEHCKFCLDFIRQCQNKIEDGGREAAILDERRSRSSKGTFL
jgi:hypothetical protein